MGTFGGRSWDSYSRRNNTNTEGNSSVCFRTQIGAMSPSGYKGDVWVSGERGECASCPVAF